MTSVQRHCAATSQTVWDVLAEPWLYPSWVVGASRIRDVDGWWPAAGAVIHHSVGAWPLLLDDTTSVVSSVAPRELVLRARGRPFGEAEVVLTLQEEPDGCLVDMAERVVRGVGRFVPGPVQDAAIALRNREALRRLALIAEGRQRETDSHGPAGEGTGIRAGRVVSGRASAARRARAAPGDGPTRPSR